MMILVSRITLVYTLLLTIFLGMQLKCGESIAPILPTKVTVQITNSIFNGYLDVHCKSKDNDLGVQHLNVQQSYSFSFFPKFFFPSTLYFCRFIWTGGDHYFDIYVQNRDGYCKDNLCSWNILGNGPCRWISGALKCFPWNPPAVGQRLLLQLSNNTLSV